MKDVLRSLKLTPHCCALAATVFFSGTTARGSGVMYSFDSVFSGATPDGPAPWFQATLEDVTPGTVRLSLSAINLCPTE